MINFSKLEKYDKNGMYKVYEGWPQLAREYYEKKYDLVDFKDIDHIIFAGMGGSGAVGDALSSIMSQTKSHIYVAKGYHLPKTADSRSLVVATSASGNTIETLTILKSAKKAKCKIVSFASGGKIEKYCLDNKIEFRKVPVLNSPRASFPIYLYSILKILSPLIPITKNQINESLSHLEKTQKKISPSNEKENISLSLAEWLSGIPIIYYPVGLQAVAIRFKNSLQENDKMHAIAEDIIEACHNGIVSWERPSNVKPILIQGKNDYIKTKELWKVIKEYFKTNKIDYKEIHSIDGHILSKIVNYIYILDFATIYRAVLSEIDPTPIKSIDFIKDRIYS